MDADDGYDEPVEPKEGERSVPIPPVLVAMLRTWIEDHQIGPDELLFRTRNNRRPSESNWDRAIKRACRRVGARAMCVYDCRHAAATFWLRTAATADPSKDVQPSGVLSGRRGHGGCGMSSQFRGPVLVVAALTMGLMAGVFDLYAHTIMRGLGETDDRTFVGAVQEIERALNNPLFALTFLGPLVFTGLAALLQRGAGGSTLRWVLAAFVLYVVVFVITFAIHAPLNDDIMAAGDPDRIADLAAVRENFHETRWEAWNVVRAVATTVAFGCLAWALVLHGRSTAGEQDDGSATAASPPSVEQV